MADYEYVTWESVNKYIDTIATYYREIDIPGVYGLPRGGLIFATMLSHKMNIPILLAPHPNCIIVDDVADSGESLTHYALNSSGDKKCKYHITTMYAKSRSTIVPELVATVVPDDTWIVFPWEEF